MKIRKTNGRRGIALARTALALACVTIALLSVAPAGSAEPPGTGTLPAVADVPEQTATLDRRATRAAPEDFRRLGAVARDEGQVRVIVGLRTLFTPEGSLDASGVSAQRGAIDSARQGVLRALAGTDHELIHSYETVPYVALFVSPRALEALEQSGLAATVQEDVLGRAALADSTRIVEATESSYWAISRHGSGQTIAVIDTGVDKAHPFLAGKVVSEACYTAGDCPGGTSSSTAVGSGVPCTFATNGCKHGTHVAGIAAGSGASFSGVAPAAQLISIRVFSPFSGASCAGDVWGENPCARYWVADTLKALEHVYKLRTTFKIAAVNMSLVENVMAGACDADIRKPIIDNLRLAGIATVIASGNSGSNAGVTAPSCISSAVTVGATTKADAVWGSSNSSPMVELLAPGTGISSSVTGGGFEAWNGTSMAAPHVAGAWAVLKQVDNTASVPTVLGRLNETGMPITDLDNSVTRPRIRVLSASVRLKDTGFKLAFDSTTRGLYLASNGVGLATRVGGPASSSVTISGIPAGAAITNAYLYWMTIGGPDDTVVFQGASRTGTLRGASRDSCWNINQLGPNRVYRADLRVLGIPGNGTYTISGVGGGSVHGQGASLVLIYTLPHTHSSPQPIRRVTLREGAMSALEGETMTNTFDGLSAPTSSEQAFLHVGMADGQAFTEDPMRFAGTAITPANFFGGSDGLLWDDHRISFSPSLIAGGWPAANSIRTGNDCLAWAYAALSYR